MGGHQNGSTEGQSASLTAKLVYLPSLLICFEHVRFPEAFLEGKVLFTALVLRSVRSSEDRWQPQSVQCVCTQHVSRVDHTTRGYNVS